MADANDNTEKHLSLINARIRVFRYGYHFWFWAHLLVGGAAIILPLASATDIDFGVSPKLLALAGGIFAAVYGFARPHEYATGFDLAVQTARAARDKYALGTIDDKSLALDLERAHKATLFKYVGPNLSNNNQ